MAASSNLKPKLILQRRRQAVQFFVEPLSQKVGIEMVLIPAGSFLMGSPKDEPGHSKSEEPQHEVTVSVFFMGKYPITQAQWKMVAALPVIDRELQLAPSQYEGEHHPVERISWYEAVEFCARLSVFTGRTYRLPSEAEWEYACRAGTTTPFHFGETVIPDLANYSHDLKYDSSHRKPWSLRHTTPVNHYAIANAFGLCDMHGNVSEWCADHRHTSYEDAPADGSAWLSEDENSSRIRRGGSWMERLEYCRSAYRHNASPTASMSNIGFRVVCKI